MKTSGRIILAGGSGFLGKLLAHRFSSRGHQVIVFTRGNGTDGGPIRRVNWDARTVGRWAGLLEGALAVINLAGRSVDCRYTAKNRRLILDSRLDPTRVLGEAMGECSQPPHVWLNSSTATIYRHTYGPAWDETGEIGGTPEAKDEFSVEVAPLWEAAFAEANTPSTRKIALRTAMVLGHGRNSVFPVLRRLVRLGLGGQMAGGRQFVSWIHEEDFCRAIGWLVERDGFSGAVNLAAPNPLTNREMMRALRRAVGVPFGLPASRWMLEAGAFILRTETELIIKSRRVTPGRLADSGFQFRFPTFDTAVANLVHRVVNV